MELVKPVRAAATPGSVRLACVDQGYTGEKAAHATRRNKAAGWKRSNLAEAQRGCVRLFGNIAAYNIVGSSMNPYAGETFTMHRESVSPPVICCSRREPMRVPPCPNRGRGRC